MLASLSPLLLLAACGSGGGEGGGADTAASDLDGLTIRKVGLVHFDVFDSAGVGAFGEEGSFDGDGAGVYTDGEVAFAEFAAPLAARDLTAVADVASPVEGCTVVDDEPRLFDLDYLESAATAISGGEVLTVRRQAGSWFEFHKIDDELDGLFYLREDTAEAEFAFFGLSGAVEPGTVIDVPGETFPPFTATPVPPQQALTGVETSGTVITWDAGSTPDTPVFIYVSFTDFSDAESPEREEGSRTDADPVDLLPVPDVPEDIRCATRDTGRFEFPEAARRSIAMARESVGISGEPEELRIDEAGSLVGEVDVVSFHVVRVGTAYRVDGDALLVVQSRSAPGL